MRRRERKRRFGQYTRGEFWLGFVTVVTLAVVLIAVLP